MPIASTAIVHPGARVHPSTVVGDYCIIEDQVEIGPNNRLDPYSMVKRYTTLGEGNHLYSGAQLGTDPLDKKFHEEVPSYLRIGSHNVLREYLTISRGTEEGTVTTIGDGNYVMTNVHIAHNCQVGNGNTICSNSLVAGHVEMEDNSFVSGGVVIHQFSKIGRLCMVAGNVRINKDIPPYFLVSEFDCAAHGLNLVGLRRAGLSREAVSALKAAFRLLYRSGLSREAALAQMEALATPEVTHLVEFIRKSQRGICPAYRGTETRMERGES
jgi:UDP-N-acetylglucosamine acyltransferase